MISNEIWYRMVRKVLMLAYAWLWVGIANVIS
jgi:hypothetical protein